MEQADAFCETEAYIGNCVFEIRLRLILTFFLCAVFLISSRAHSQDVEHITYDGALKMALLQNTNVKRAENEADLQGAIVAREYMDFLPSVEISNRGTRTFGRSFSQEEGAILSETSDFYALEANANMDLFHGFEGISSLMRAKKERDASRLMAQRAKQDALFEVVDRFAALLQNQELLRGRQEELKAQENLLRQVEGLVKVGRRPTSDLYQQQASRAEAEVSWLGAKRDVALAEMALIRLLRLSPQKAYEFDAASFPQVAETTDSLSFQNLLEAAFQNRLDMQAETRRVDARKHDLRIARSGYWPRLALRYSYGSDWSSTARQPIPGTGSPARSITITPDDGSAPATFQVPGSSVAPDNFQPDFSDQLKDRRGGSIQLALDIPIFDRFETRTDVKAAQVDLADAQYAMQDLQNDIALDVRRAIYEYQTAFAQWEAAKNRLKAAGLARDAAQRRYELGAATFVELAQSISTYVGARGAEVRARYATVRARELIRYQTGRLAVPDATSP